MHLKVVSKPFHQLLPDELYAVLQLRSEVFVVEQHCIFQDMDDKDQRCYHLLLYDTGLVAYARLLPPGIAYEEMSIGRIITKKSVRRTGIGKILLDKAIEQIHELFGPGPIRIGAQLYARVFYERFGFVQCSDVYDEDGIDHIEMIKV